MRTPKALNKEGLVNAFEDYADSIYRYIYIRVGMNQESAEDLSQEVFMKAWSLRDNYKESKSSMKTWLYLIARGVIVDFYRKSSTKGKDKKASLEVDQIERFADLKDKSKELEDSILSDWILSKLKELSDEEQELIILRYIEDQDIKTISKIVNKKRSATKVAIHRAMNKLKKIVNEENK